MSNLEWRDVPLVTGSLSSGINTLVDGAALVQGGLTAVQTALSAVQLASLASAYNDAMATLVNSVLGAFADILQGPGVYPILIYPRGVDYNRALILEKRESAAKQIASLRAEMGRISQLRASTELERRQQSNARARVESSLRSFEAEHRRLTTESFRARSDLLTTFSFQEWLGQFDRSLSDTGDLARPLFTRSSIVTGVAVIVQTNTLSDFPPLLSALADWAQHKGLKRSAESLTRLTETSLSSPSAQTASTPPDWQSWSLARALGLEQQIAFLRRGASAFTLPTVGRSDSATRALRTIALLNAALQESIDVGNSILQTVAALQGLANTKGSVLLVPPTQGERVVQLSSGPATVPIYTQGIDGFSTALRNATNAPTSRWCAGLVMLSGVPVGGLDGATALSEIGLAPGVQAARGQAELAYRFLRGAW